jgi:phosphatidylglycerol:prolipoprotein diacylglycerol transferase
LDWGRAGLGNFINGELVGRVTDVPWAMVFPQVDMLPRHPSQLYQFALEGVALFLILWMYASRPPADRAISGLFLAGVRQLFASSPNTRASRTTSLGYLAGGFTMGQLLSLPMIVAGFALMLWSYRRAGQGAVPTRDRQDESSTVAALVDHLR